MTVSRSLALLSYYFFYSLVAALPFVLLSKDSTLLRPADTRERSWKEASIELRFHIFAHIVTTIAIVSFTNHLSIAAHCLSHSVTEDPPANDVMDSQALSARRQRNPSRPPRTSASSRTSLPLPSRLPKPPLKLVPPPLPTLTRILKSRL